MQQLATAVTLGDDSDVIRDVQQVLFVVGTLLTAASVAVVLVTAFLTPRVIRHETDAVPVSRLPFVALGLFLSGAGVVLVSALEWWLVPLGVALVAVGAYVLVLERKHVARLFGKGDKGTRGQ